MGRPKGSRNREEKPVQVAQEAVHGTEQEEQEPQVNEEPARPVFGFDKCIYHEDHEPRLLKAGEPMPEGWNDHARFEKVRWTFDRFGKWTRENK